MKKFIHVIVGIVSTFLVGCGASISGVSHAKLLTEQKSVVVTSTRFEFVTGMFAKTEMSSQFNLRWINATNGPGFLATQSGFGSKHKAYVVRPGKYFSSQASRRGGGTLTRGTLEGRYKFTVEPGEVIYIGEVVIDVRDGLNRAKSKIENHEQAALAALTKINPALAEKMIVRIARGRAW